MFGPRLLARWPGLRCPVSYFLFLYLCGLFANCPGPGGCALSRLYSPVRLAGLNSLSLSLSSVVGRPLLSFSPVVILWVSLRTRGPPSQCAVSIGRIPVDTLGVACNLKGTLAPNLTFRWSYSALDLATDESSHINHVVLLLIGSSISITQEPFAYVGRYWVFLCQCPRLFASVGAWFRIFFFI